MEGTIVKRFMSRKFLVAVGAAVIAFVGSAWPEQEDLIEQIVLLALGYILAQGVVDTATEARGIKDEHK